MDGPGPVTSSSDDRARSWLILATGLVITAGLVFALIALWPEGDDAPGRLAGTEDIEPSSETSTTKVRQGTGEPSQQTTTTSETSSPGTVDLFRGDLPVAYADLLAAAGNPTQVIELAVYDTYAFLAYRDPANPGNIDRRIWRDGEVGDAEPNPIDDRVDADTEPSLFGPGEVDPALLARLIADAPSHYELPTQVTHVLVDRFLPFDERVLIRVYASPTDGRSGGGYISYDTAGALVDTCC
jgi:hypothetical protein